MSATNREEALAALKPRQLRAVAALLKHGAVSPAAAEAGCSARTLRRWCSQEPFRRALAAQASESMTGALQQLQDAAQTAVATLRAALADPNVFARMQAGGALLAYSLKAAEHLEIGARLERLEQQLAEQRERDPRPARGGDPGLN